MLQSKLLLLRDRETILLVYIHIGFSLCLVGGVHDVLLFDFCVAKLK